MVTQIQDFIRKLTETQAGSKIMAELEDTRLSKRLALADEIAAIRADAMAKAPEIQKAIEKAQAKFDKAQEARLASRQELELAKSATSSNSVSSRISRLEGELRQTADMETIRTFTDDLDILHGQVRHGSHSRPPVMERLLDGRSRVKEEGNASDVSMCLGQIVAARREAADVVVLEPLDKAALAARLEALRESIVFPS